MGRLSRHSAEVCLSLGGLDAVLQAGRGSQTEIPSFQELPSDGGSPAGRSKPRDKRQRFRSNQLLPQQARPRGLWGLGSESRTAEGRRDRRGRGARRTEGYAGRFGPDPARQGTAIPRVTGH